MRIRKGVRKPSDPRENGTTGGTGPLNNDAACIIEKKNYISNPISSFIKI